MARPQTGPPPVERSAVARTDGEGSGKKRALDNYAKLAEDLRRPDRYDAFRAMLGDDASVERFLAVVLHAISTDSNLLINADPASILQAVKDSAALGLEPTGLGGEGWIVLYGKTATFLPGWQGYLKRIRNSGAVRHVATDVVYQNDEFDWGRSSSSGFWYKHHPAIGDRGDYVGAYAHVVMRDGTSDGEWMSLADITAVAKEFSASVKAGKKSPWTTSWGEMARKTVLKRLAKRLPQESIAQLVAQDERAAKVEEAVLDEDGSPFDVGRARRAALSAIGVALPDGKSEQPTLTVEPPPGDDAGPAGDDPATDLDDDAAYVDTVSTDPPTDG